MTGSSILLKELRQFAVSRGLTVAAAESVTGGLVQARLSSISGASDFFEGGLTAYQIPQKVRLLGVAEKVAVACNAVSEQVAQQMASGACELFQSDLAVATTGYAEVDSAREKPAPYAWLCVASRVCNPSHASDRSNQHGPFQLTALLAETTGSRAEAQEHFADRAIALLHEKLRNLHQSGSAP